MVNHIYIGRQSRDKQEGIPRAKTIGNIVPGKFGGGQQNWCGWREVKEGESFQET